jgi:hypothetical protein
MGKASGVNFMLQRFGAVFGIAIATAVFSGYGGLGSASAVVRGLGPALGVCAGLSLLGGLVALLMVPSAAKAPPESPRTTTVVGAEAG